MPQLGRPRINTSQGIAVPTNEIGLPDLGLGGFGGGGVLSGVNSPWRMYSDETEWIPELTWPNNIPVFEQMRTDSQMAGLLTATMWGITQLRFVVDPNGCDEAKVKEISEDLNVPIMGQDDQPRNRMKGRFVHSKHVFDALLSVIYGHYHFEQVVVIRDGKARLKKLAPRPPQTIRQINVADDGGLVNIEQHNNRIDLRTGVGLRPPIPVDRLVAFVFQQEGKSQTGRSMLRDCYKDWILKDRNLRIEAINHARAGGVPYAVAPMGSTDTQVEQLHQMMKKFQIGEESGAAVPFGTELKIAKGTGSDVSSTIKRFDEAMARRFLLQLMNLAQGGQNIGSYALSETFEDSFLIGQRVIAQWYCDTMTEHVIEDLVDWNYGEDEPLAPRLTWERSTEDSLGVEALATLVEKKIITVDDELENRIRYRYLLPKLKGSRVDIMKQEMEATTPPKPDPVVAPVKKPTSAGHKDPAGLPVGSSAPVRAKWWPFRRKPDVMAKGPVLVTIPNVPIMEVGVEYQLSTGPTTFTPEDLADAMTAANEDPAIPPPRLKIGHTDARFNNQQVYDGSPAFGKATNLRLGENGMTLYADYVGVPKWYADIMPTAYPSRSIEGFFNIESNQGKTWRFVLSAVALLGVTWPGISRLEDLPPYYGDEIPEGVVLDDQLAEAVAAARNQPGGGPMSVSASANLDDVRRAFYNDYIPEHTEAYWYWIRQVLTGPNELVVEDDETGQLYKIPFSSDTTGAVSFGDAAAVRVEYVPDDRESQKAAATLVAATLAIGRKVLASYNDREESIPATNETGGLMDPREIRQRLNLPEDATPEQVAETLAALNAAATAAQTEDPPTPEPPAQAAPPAPETAPEPAAIAAAAAPASAVPAGVVMIDEAAWKQMQEGVAASTKRVEETRKATRENLVAAAIGDGRIPSARKEYWLHNLTVDFEGYSATLASLQKGVIPVEAAGEIGHSVVVDGGQVQIADEQVSTWTQQLFPETRPQVAAGLSLDPRIHMDAAYQR